MRTRILSIVAIGAILSASIVSAAPGDYPEVQCSTQAFFGANSCNQCFDGGKITVGQKLTGFADSWTNSTKNDLVAYKDEQTYPSMVSLNGSGTTWKINPDTPSLYWKYGNEVVWTKSLTGSGKEEFTLDAGKKIGSFMEADFGASYSLEKTDAKAGSYVGLMKFPVTYHELSSAGVEGVKQTHTECVAFSTAAAPTPTKVTPPKPVTPTKVKTGPESVLLVGLALLLGMGIVSYRRRKAQ